MLTLIPVILQALQAGLTLVPEVIAAAQTELALFQSGATPTPEQQAAIDQALDIANAALQTIDPATGQTPVEALAASTVTGAP